MSNRDWKDAQRLLDSRKCYCVFPFIPLFIYLHAMQEGKMQPLLSYCAKFELLFCLFFLSSHSFLSILFFFNQAFLEACQLKNLFN